jgi:hypothetical protein
MRRGRGSEETKGKNKKQRLRNKKQKTKDQRQKQKTKKTRDKRQKKKKEKAVLSRFWAFSRGAC